MIVKRLLDLTNLIKTRVFYIYKMTKVVIIDKHKDFVFAIFLVMPLYFKSFDDY